MSAPDDWLPHELQVLCSDADPPVILLDGEHKDEWLHHLYDRLVATGRGVSAATKRTDDGMRYEERWFNDSSSASSRLLIWNAKGGLIVALGRAAAGDPSADAAWRYAAMFATASVGTRRDNVAWQATLCQRPTSRGLTTRVG